MKTVQETRLYYERLTFTSIELNLLFTNIASLSSNNSLGSINSTSTDHTSDTVAPNNDSVVDGLSGMHYVNKSIDNHNIPTEPDDVRDALWIVIPISIIYSTIFVIGVLGNVITCIVISKNKSMHTATNYYLFSLAVSDLLLLLTGVPQEVYLLWYRYPYPFDNNVCILQGFAAETSANATVLTITAFTIERYVAICKPFRSHTMSKLSRAIRYILAIWVIAMCLAVPQALALEIDEQFSMCTVRRDQQRHVFTISTVIVFVIPMCVLTILYVLIGLQLRRSKVMKRGTALGSSIRLKHTIFKKNSHRTIVSINYQNDSPQHYSESMLMQQQPLQARISLPGSINASGNNVSSMVANDTGMVPIERSLMVNNVHHQLVEQTNSLLSEDGRINYSNRVQYHSTRHVVKMLVAVVIAFFLCWAPFHAQRLFAVYGGDQNNNEAIRIAFEIVTHISGILYFVSTCINPVLYNIMSHKFREAFKETLKNYLYRRSGHQLRQRMFFRNVSLRSSSINSFSMNTCSSVCCTTNYPLQQSSIFNETTTITASPMNEPCSNQNPIRYREIDVARLKRPLVVSFRKIPPTTVNSSPEPRQIGAHRCNTRRQFFHSNEQRTTKLSSASDADLVSYRKHCCLQEMLLDHTQMHPSKATSENNPDSLDFSSCWTRYGNNFPTVRSTKHRWFPIKYLTESNRFKYSPRESMTATSTADERSIECHRQTKTPRSHLAAHHTPTQLKCKYDLYPQLRNVYHSSNSRLTGNTLHLDDGSDALQTGKLLPVHPKEETSSSDVKTHSEWDVSDKKLPNSKSIESFSSCDEDKLKTEKAPLRELSINTYPSQPTVAARKASASKYHSLPSVFKLDNNFR
ncbi:5-hydroxytryptamine receptor-like [Armigeres subalbatus]|uniref:5-hydroxytryptamine receptor-like n=1 Tax=Armigeres subalbatus TaxID=124917 RepID=UPI002ED66082